MLKSKFPILPILPNKSQCQNPKLKNSIWARQNDWRVRQFLWRNLGFIWDFVVFGFGIFLGFFILCPHVYALNLDKLKINFLSDDYQSAILEGEKILAGARQAADLDELYYFLGLSYLKDGNLLRAADIFEIILKEFKNSRFSEGATLGLGDAYFLRGNFREAEKYYQDLLENMPRTNLKAEIYHRLSQVAFKKGNLAEGREYISRLENEFPAALKSGILRDLSVLPQVFGGNYYTVQVGSFANIDNARTLLKRLTRGGYTAYIEEAAREGKTIYRVRVGKSDSRKQAENLEQRLSQEGYPTKICP